MQLPPQPALRSKQRFEGRFWTTHDMMEILSIYHGQLARPYPHTWQYRTLIAVLRAKHSTNMLRKPYGPDWKCLTRAVGENGVERFVPDKGFALKDDVLEYLTQGRIPLDAKQFAAHHLRDVELRLWTEQKLQAASQGAQATRRVA